MERHWVEHSGEHADEFKEYAARSADVGDQLLAAARSLEQTNARLGEALETLGGPLEHSHV